MVKKQETDSSTVKPEKRTVHRGIFRILIQMRESGRDSSFILGSSDKKCILLDTSSALGSGEEASHQLQGTPSATEVSVTAHRKQKFRLSFLLSVE